MVTRRTIRRTCEVRVAKAAAPAPCSHPTLAVFREVNKKVARLCVNHLRADWNTNCCVLAFPARTVRAFAVSPTFGSVLGVVAQMQQRVQRRVGDEPDVAAAPTVAARRPAARHKLLTTKRRH